MESFPKPESTPEDVEKINKQIVEHSIKKENVQSEEKEEIQKIERILEPLYKLGFKLRRQEEENRSSVIDATPFISRVHNLEDLLKKDSNIEEIRGAILSLKDVIGNTGQIPKFRNLEKGVEDLRNIIYGLKYISEEVFSIKSSFGERPEIQIPLSKLQDEIQDKVDSLIRATDRLRNILDRRY